MGNHMNENVLKYKGYYTVISYSAEDSLLFGKIESINDLIDFSSDSVDGIKTEFQNAVDAYLELCKKLGKEPEKTYSGTFNVRIDPLLHKRLSLKAALNNSSLNAETEKAIKSYLESDTPSIRYVIQFQNLTNTGCQLSEHEYLSDMSLWNLGGNNETLYRGSTLANQFN